MSYKKIIKAEKALKTNRIFKIGIILSGIFSLAFGVVTFYGQDSGNFMMSIDKETYTRGIILSSTEDFEYPQPRLLTDPVDQARDLTYRWLKINEISETDGNYSDPDFDYVAYTFYLKNNGNETVNIAYHIKITEVSRDMDEAIRVLIIEDGDENMYQKEDQKDAYNQYPIYPPTLPEATLFLSEDVIARELITNFKPNDVKKFSVVVWIEGYDPDTTDDILGGNIKMEMIFSIENRS
jgi:hypothetical protein